MESIVFDVGETLTRDDRYWGSCADWLGVPRHTLSALVGAVVAQGRDNADAVRLVRPGIDIDAERAAKEAAGAVAYKYGHQDLSARLVELTRWAAPAAEDPLLDAAVAYCLDCSTGTCVCPGVARQ